MLFEIRQVNANDVNRNRIDWIKRCRDQTDLGLKEAKDLYDWARIRVGQSGHSIILDTDARPEFRFLDSNRKVRDGWSDLVKLDRSPEFRQTDSEVDQILAKIGAKINKPSKSAEQILKQTAITLIRGNHIKHAKGVLEILM